MRKNKIFLPFHIATKKPAVVISLCHTVIYPMVIYGFKASAITKQNRIPLRKMEKVPVKYLRNLSRDPTQSKSDKELLRGSTVNRKCRVHMLEYWEHVV